MQGLEKILPHVLIQIKLLIHKIILVINDAKNDIENYIGANSFAEIAFGFYFNKQVYLLNGIYEPYKDDLIGWNVNTLKGNLDKLNIEVNNIRLKNFFEGVLYK